MNILKTTQKYFIFLTIIFIIYVSYYMSIGMEWWDQINYISLAKSISDTGHIFPFCGYEYNDFLQNEKLTPIFKEYPNYLFVCLLAVVIKLFGFGSLLPFYSVNIIFSILFLIALYRLFLYITRDEIESNMLVFIYCISPCFLYLVFGGRTEISLLFFFVCSIFASLKNNYIYAGMLLGIGFCFREQAIMFVPVVPLCVCESLTLKKYTASLCKCVVGFAVGLALKVLLYYLFFSGPTSLFYLKENSSIITSSFIVKFIYNTVKTVFLFTHRASLMLIIPFIICFSYIFFMRKKTLNSSISIRFSIVAMILFYMPLYRYGIDMELRFLIYACLFAVLALVFFLRNFHIKKYSMLSSVIAVSLLILLPRLNDGIDLNENFHPVEFYRGENNKIILTNSPAIINYVFEQPTCIGLPKYDIFYKSQNNEKIDYIALTTKLSGNNDFWLCGEFIEDVHGNRFELQQKFNSLRLRVYKRKEN